jgi:hypothetical protein
MAFFFWRPAAATNARTDSACDWWFVLGIRAPQLRTVAWRKGACARVRRLLRV